MVIGSGRGSNLCILLKLIMLTFASEFVPPVCECVISVSLFGQRWLLT